MGWLTRSLVYAGVFSCVCHILLLGVAASVAVAPPMHSATPVRVTLVQRAVPLPVQELPKGGEEPKAVATLLAPPPAPVQQKPVPPRFVAEKKPKPRVTPRPPKPVVKPKRIPLPEPPAEMQEEPAQVALATPPPLEVPVQESGAVTTDEQVTTGSEDSGNTDALANGGADGAFRLAGRTGGNGQGGGTEGAGGLSATPDYNVNPKPPYPLLARRIGAQGEVLLRVLVRPDGSVATVELARSSGFLLLDESATRTVRDNWRFIPARHDGAPVESWVEIPITFVLADS